MLFIVIVWLGNRTRLLGAFTSDQDFAASLLFKSFLIQTFGANDHSDVVDTIVLGNVDFLFYLICIKNRPQLMVKFWIVVYGDLSLLFMN